MPDALAQLDLLAPVQTRVRLILFPKPLLWPRSRGSPRPIIGVCDFARGAAAPPPMFRIPDVTPSTSDSQRSSPMLNKLTLTFLAAVTTASIVSPAFAE